MSKKSGNDDLKFVQSKIKKAKNYFKNFKKQVNEILNSDKVSCETFSKTLDRCPLRQDKNSERAADEKGNYCQSVDCAVYSLRNSLEKLMDKTINYARSVQDSLAREDEESV